MRCRDRAVTFLCLFALAILIDAIVCRSSIENIFGEFTAEFKTVPKVLETVLSLVAHPKYIIIRDIPIDEQKHCSAFNIRKIFFGNSLEDMSFSLGGKDYWLRSKRHWKIEVERNPIFGDEKINSRGLILRYGLTGVSEGYVNNNWCIGGPDYASFDPGRVKDIGLFRIDKGSLAYDQSASGHAVESNRRYGGDNREQRDYEIKLCDGIIISPKALLGILCISLLPYGIHRSLQRRGSFWWLVFAFLLAHLGAYLLGFYSLASKL